jgi:hypothetical protein
MEKIMTDREPAETVLGGRRGCFPGYTKIMTPAGLLPIAAINEGDEVYALDSDDKVVAKRVFYTTAHPARSIIAIKSEKASFEVTRTHSIRTSKGFKRVRSIAVGDIVLASKGPSAPLEQHRVVAVEEKPKPVPVYNLVVEGSYTFLTEACIAHSFSRFKTLRMFFHEIMRLVIKRGPGVDDDIKDYGF